MMMKISLLFLLCILSPMPVMPQSLLTQDRLPWDWIVPGQTTRSQVERILGASKEKDKTEPYQTYNAGYAGINIQFASKALAAQKCAGPIEKDTVVSLFVTPSERTSIKQLPYDLSSFKRNGIYSPREITYFNEAEAILIDSQIVEDPAGVAIERVRAIEYRIPCVIKSSQKIQPLAEEGFVF